MSNNDDYIVERVRSIEVAAVTSVQWAVEVAKATRNCPKEVRLQEEIRYLRGIDALKKSLDLF